MVSSPFGGVEHFDRALWEEVCLHLNLDFRGRRVLDVGCGRALCAPVLQEQGADYVGMDLIQSHPGSIRLSFCIGEGGRIPFQRNSFNAIICLDAFEHFPEPIEAVREFERVLAPNGFVFLSIPNYRNVAGLVKKWMETFGGYEKNTWAPFGGWTAQAQEHFMTPGRIKRWFRQAGMRQFHNMGLDREIISGLFPWYELPGFPESLRFLLQRRGTIPRWLLARVLPSLSLHLFWKIER